MSDAITLDVLSSSPVQLDVGDADPIAREEIAELTERVTTVEGDVSGLSTRVGTAEGDISALGTTVDGIDTRVEAIEADGSVTTAKLADSAVTTAKLTNGAVTDAKLVQTGGVLSEVDRIQTLSEANLLDGVTFVQGTISQAEGNEGSSTTRIRSGYIPLAGLSSFTISTDEGYDFVVDWFDEDKHVVRSSYWYHNHGEWQSTERTYCDFSGSAYVRLLVRNSDNTSTILPEEAAHLHVTFADALTSVSEFVRPSHEINGSMFEWELGSFYNGEPIVSNTRIRSRRIPMGKGSVISVDCGTSSPYTRITAHYLDHATGAALGDAGGATWFTESLKVPYDCDAIILVSKSDDATIASEGIPALAEAVTVHMVSLHANNNDFFFNDGLTVSSESSYFEPVGRSGGMWCKLSTLWFRGPQFLVPSVKQKDITWADVLPDSHDTSPLGIADCLLIPHNSSLVYDIDANALAIVANRNRTFAQVPLLMILTGASGDDEVVGGKLYHAYARFMRENGASPAAQTRVKASAYAALVNDSEETEQFLYFTDPHLMGYSNDATSFVSKFESYVATIKSYVESTPVTFSMCGGDWLNSGDKPSVAKWKLGLIHGACKRLGKFCGVVGNHDTNYQGVDENDTANSGMLANQTIANAMFGGEHKNYYKFDGTNTRFYVFDSGTDWDNTMTAYRWEQVAWFANGLLTDDKAHSSVSIHIWYTNFNDPTADTISNLATNIASVIAAYNGRTTVTLNGSTYDFSSCIGHVEFIICGHTHFDKSGTSGTIPVVNTLNTQKGSTPSFDLVYVDYDNRTLNTVRVGTGSNRTFDLDVTPS